MTSGAFSLSLPQRTVPDLGKRFQALRKQAGKTQAEIALAVGMRQEALSRFETGSGTDFSLGKLLRLLQVLELEIDFKPMTRRPTLSDVLNERRSGANTGPDAK
jgi:HTH-type transcriptional regulator/antitoxin HipB